MTASEFRCSVCGVLIIVPKWDGGQPPECAGPKDAQHDSRYMIPAVAPSNVSPERDARERECNEWSDRVEKTGVTMEQGMGYPHILTEIESLASDSTPVLDPDTVRIESVDPTAKGAYRVTITGEVSGEAIR